MCQTLKSMNSSDTGKNKDRVVCKMMKKAAIYRRVSLETQVDNFSLAGQKRELEDACRYRKLEIVADYVEEGVSGKNCIDRPQFAAMVEAAKRKEFGYIAVASLTRFSRSIFDLIRVTTELEAHGVAIISLSEGIDTSSAAGKLLLHVMGSFAEYERELICLRTTAGRAERAKQGMKTATKILGYANENKTLVVLSAEATLVRLIFDLYIELNNLHRVAERLGALGYVGKQGKPFTAYGVMRILDNVAYVGRNNYVGKQYQGTHEPIIDKDTFDRVRDIRESTGKKKSRK